jgi:hypothetical protein
MLASEKIVGNREKENFKNIQLVVKVISVPDPRVFGPPGSGSISQRYGSGSRFPILPSLSKYSKKKP